MRGIQPRQQAQANTPALLSQSFSDSIASGVVQGFWQHSAVRGQSVPEGSQGTDEKNAAASASLAAVHISCSPAGTRLCP